MASMDGARSETPESFDQGTYLIQISQLQEELAEFKAASKELETELENELVESQHQQAKLESQLADALHQVQTWKQRYSKTQAEAAANEQRFTAQIESLREVHNQTQQRMRAIEIENDDRERAGRIFETSLQQLEQKNAELLELLAFAEADRAEKTHLSEQLQRTRDELRDTLEELSITHTKDTALPNASLPQSRSLRKMAGIIGQVENLEGRVATVRRKLSARRVQSLTTPVPEPWTTGGSSNWLGFTPTSTLAGPALTAPALAGKPDLVTAKPWLESTKGTVIRKSLRNRMQTNGTGFMSQQNGNVHMEASTTTQKGSIGHGQPLQ